MKRVSFENEFNGKFIPEDQIDLFYEKMKDTVVKICAILDHIEANDENEDVEMNDQEYVSSTRQARKQAAQNIEVVKSSVGTGVIIKKGYVLTAEHVVAGAKVVFIRNVEKNDYYRCSIVKSNENTDLALLEIEKKKVKFLTRRVELTPRNDTMVGSQALHIGHPNDYDYSFLRGAVAHPRRRCEGNMAAEFQLNNLHGAEGSSGGPIFDAGGLLIGILLSAQSHTGLTNCAHMDVVKDFLEECFPGQKSKKSKSRAIDDDNDDDEKEPKYSVKVSGFDGKDVEDEYSIEEEENSNDEEEDEDEEKEDGDLVLFKLAKLFGKCGKILRIFFPLDKTTKKRKGYALIEFKDEAGVNKALLKDETTFFQKIYKVKTV